MYIICKDKSIIINEKHEKSKQRLKENARKKLKVTISKLGEYFEEDVKNEVKVEVPEEEEKVEVKVKESPNDSEGEKLKEDEVAEISSDEEVEVEYPDPERLKKELKENQIYLCPVGSCAFSLESPHLDEQHQHFKLFHSELDYSELRFLKL